MIYNIINLQALFNRGICYEKLDKLEDAENDFNNAKNLNNLNKQDSDNKKIIILQRLGSVREKIGSEDKLQLALKDFQM